MRGSILTVSAAGLALAAVAGAAQQRTGTAQPRAAAAAPTRIVASARALLATLDDAGRAKVQFPFDGPQRTRWSNLPSGIFKREGLRLGDLTPKRRTAV